METGEKMLEEGRVGSDSEKVVRDLLKKSNREKTSLTRPKGICVQIRDHRWIKKQDFLQCVLKGKNNWL